MAIHAAPPVNQEAEASPLDAVVAGLVQARQINGRTVIFLPITTSSGGGISVSVWPEGGDTFMVSDDGTAYHEVSTACASERTFTRVAQAACQRYGATFDGMSMFLMRVTSDRLKGAIVAMGSLIKEVVDRTVERSFVARFESEREDFVRRVAETFTPQRIEEGAVIFGESTTPHEFDVVVKAEGRTLAFDVFSKAPTSVSAAFLKLADIARLPNGPAPIGVTPDLDAVGPKLTLLNSVGRIIEARASRMVLARLVT
jgi:hypothetical protein